MYQFVSYEACNQQRIVDLMHEARRTPAYSKHVQEVQPPIHLCGKKFPVLINEIEEEVPKIRRTVYKKVRGGTYKNVTSKLDKRKLVAIAGTVSFPADWVQRNPDMFNEIIKVCVRKLKDMYGPLLQNVTGHQDEPNPHIHFFAWSDDYDLSKVCTADKAEREVGRSRKLKNAKDRKEARREALKKFQKEWNDVLYSFGFLQYGPRRKHLPTSQWKALKADQETTARLLFDLKQAQRESRNGQENTLSNLGL